MSAALPQVAALLRAGGSATAVAPNSKREQPLAKSILRARPMTQPLTAACNRASLTLAHAWWMLDGRLSLQRVAMQVRLPKTQQGRQHRWGCQTRPHQTS